MSVKQYSLSDLDTLTSVIEDRLNKYAALVTEAQRDSFNKKKTLFIESAIAYKAAAQQFPFLKYTPPSVKPSLFSYLGNYLGFQGYYNPFSGEAQGEHNRSPVPRAFVTTHEIAHQLGYAKENEANFVAFLACRNYESPVFKYSMYFDMYNYSIGEV